VHGDGYQRQGVDAKVRGKTHGAVRASACPIRQQYSSHEHAAYHRCRRLEAPGSSVGKPALHEEILAALSVLAAAGSVATFY